jgi:hypothetical protein
LRLRELLCCLAPAALSVRGAAVTGTLDVFGGTLSFLCSVGETHVEDRSGTARLSWTGGCTGA